MAGAKSSDRQARLAAALRENLKRRKARERAGRQDTNGEPRDGERGEQRPAGSLNPARKEN
jgi:hypothetical protein